MSDLLHEVTISIKVDPNQVDTSAAVELVEADPLFSYLEDELQDQVAAKVRQAADASGLSSRAFTVEVSN